MSGPLPAAADAPTQDRTASAGRLLLVTYHFAPDFTIGSFRGRRIAMHMQRLGWTVDVLTTRRIYQTQIDENMCRGLEDVTAHRTHALNPRALVRRPHVVGSEPQATPTQAAPAPLPSTPSALRRAARKLTDWLATGVQIPDDCCGWIPIALAAGARLPKPDVIVTTGPVFTNLIVATLLARRFGSPLILDYRDPWNPLARKTDLPAWRRRLEARLEGWCLATASEIVTTTSGIADEIGDLAGRPVHVVTNACEPERFEGITPQRFDRPTIVYAGALYASRTLDVVLDALARLRDDGRLDPSRLQLVYMGRSAAKATEAIASRGLQAFCRIDGIRPNSEALAATLGAGCNLSIVGDEHLRQIPAKIFEHIASGRPMLTLVQPGSDTEELLRTIPSARCVSPDDARGLEEVLLEVAEAGMQPHTGEVPSHLTAEATMEQLHRIALSARSAPAIRG